MHLIFIISAISSFYSKTSSELIAEKAAEFANCGTCEPNACEPPRDCLAGFVKDSCNCCYLCGRKEGERCSHQDVFSEGLGDCGENLKCLVRTDLDWNDPPEAICVCQQHKYLCGSDGVTYENICQLTEARYSRRDGLRAVSSQPCVKAPNIVSPPINVRNTTGSNAALSCEANGWPVPVIEWEMQGEDDTIIIPENDSRAAVQTRNGPDPWETTSWLLFLNLSQDDEGTYFCRARNDVGSAEASATVIVV